MNLNNYKVVIVGATGLTGSVVVEKLLLDPNCTHIYSISRKPLAFENSSKIKQYIIPLENLKTLAFEFNADVAICCLGTTMKIAGSKSAFLKVDYEYVEEFAKLCKLNSVKKFILQSSIGANKSSSNFYLKTKGQIEEKIQNMNFDKLIVFRPSVLDGNRKEFRLGEKIGIWVTKLIGYLLVGSLLKYRVTDIEILADRIVQYCFYPVDTNCEIVENDKIISNE